MSTSPSRRLAAVIAVLSLVLPVAAARAVPDPDVIAATGGPDRAGVLLSLGLGEAAEELLVAEVDSGGVWARSPLVGLLLRTGRADEAATRIEAWGGPDSLGTDTNRFLQARVEESRNRWAEAAAAYGRSAETEPLLADHAGYRAARSLESNDRYDEALEYYERSSAAARSATLAARASWDAARLALRLEEPERALENLERIPPRSVIARSDLLDLQADIQHALGSPEREARALRELLDVAPRSDPAARAVGRLSALEPPTVSDRIAFCDVALANRDPVAAERQAREVLRAIEKAPDAVAEGRARLRLGEALMARRRYTQAREELALLPAEARAEDRAEALLDRARCLWKLDLIDACLFEYDEIADGDWPEEARATAAWEAGREAKDNRRWEETALRLAEFQRLYPDHEYAADAAWHTGRALAELGRTEEAANAFELVRTRYPDSPLAAEATYWMARTEREAGRPERACAELARLLRESPDSYWAERARERLDRDPCPADSVPLVVQTDLDPLEWLAAQLPDLDPEDARRRAATLETADRFRRAAVLAAVGLSPEAETELGGLRRALEADTAGLLVFAQKAWRIGVPREAMRAVLVVKARTRQEVLSGGLPPSVARLLYPIDHLDAVLRWSHEYRLDPWFVYAVMREESWFDSRAVSWAGAQGLLQIMPSTGRDLARRVGLRHFRSSDLFDPDVNIHLGAYYLSELLDDLDREPALALSAYNAGKGNALRWKEGLDGGFDVDRYVAGITYRETYGYVQKVTRTWAIYRRLYDGLLERIPEIAGSR